VVAPLCGQESLHRSDITSVPRRVITSCHQEGYHEWSTEGYHKCVQEKLSSPLAITPADKAHMPLEPVLAIRGDTF